MKTVKKYFSVDNLKCSGCSNTVETQIGKIEGVQEVVVHLDKDEVEVTFNEDLPEAVIAAKLKKLGYPARGTSKFTDNAKSVVSCMIGRVTK